MRRVDVEQEPAWSRIPKGICKGLHELSSSSSYDDDAVVVRPLHPIKVQGTMDVCVVLYAPKPLSQSCLPLERLLEAKVS